VSQETGSKVLISPPMNVTINSGRTHLYARWISPERLDAAGLEASNLEYTVTVLNDRNETVFFNTTDRTSMGVWDLNPATLYYFSIAASKDSAESSNISRVVYTSPTRPTISIKPEDIGSTWVKMVWSIPDKIASGAVIEHYTIKYFTYGRHTSKDRGHEVEVPSNQTELTVTNLLSRAYYSFMVSVSTDKGRSGFSNGKSITTKRIAVDLAKLQQEFSQEIESLKEELKETKKTLREELAAQKTEASVMCAYQSTVDNYPPLSGTLDGVIVYDRVYHMGIQHSSFDAQSGVFQAAKTGIYLVSASARYGYTKNNAELELTLKTNSGKYQDNGFYYQRASGVDELFSSISVSRFVNLEEGEQLWLQYVCRNGCRIGALEICVSFYV